MNKSQKWKDAIFYVLMIIAMLAVGVFGTWLIASGVILTHPSVVWLIGLTSEQFARGFYWAILGSIWIGIVFACVQFARLLYISLKR